MADRYRRGGSERDFDRGDETPNRGMFGYEGEGYMRGGGGGNDYDEYASRGYGRDTWADDSTYRGGGGYGQSRGGDDYTTGFSGGSYGTGDRYGTGGYGRGAYGGGGHMSGGGGDFEGGGFSGGSGWNRGREYGRGEAPADYRRSSSDEDTRGSYFSTGSVGADPRGYRDLEAGVGRDTNRQSHRGKGPKNYQRSDERIREDLCERLAMDHHVDASDIEVAVSGGTVTLTGTVSDRRAKRRAEDLCESINGVKDVENQIRVSRGPD